VRDVGILLARAAFCPRAPRDIAVVPSLHKPGMEETVKRCKIHRQPESVLRDDCCDVVLLGHLVVAGSNSTRSSMGGGAVCSSVVFADEICVVEWRIEGHCRNLGCRYSNEMADG